MSESNRVAVTAEPWSHTHPIVPQDRVVMEQLRTLVAPNKGRLRGVAGRAPFDAINHGIAAPADVTFRRDSVGGIDGWWCEPADAASDAVILHAHGGWFTWGSAGAFRHLVGHVARNAHANAFIPDYRLAPEHAFPAGLDDIYACYQGLVERGITTIALTGDSAGGNFALLTLARIVAQTASESSVVAAVALSPVTDLAMTGASWESRADADPYFVRDQIEELIAGYLAGHAATDAAASPLYGDLAGLPSIRVHVGDDEVLLDDARRYVKRAIDAGVDARLEVWEGMPHGFIGAIGRLDAATRALSAIGAFLGEKFSLLTVRSN